jgi:hypothetical protein
MSGSISSFLTNDTLRGTPLAKLILGELRVNGEEHFIEKVALRMEM